MLSVERLKAVLHYDPDTGIFTRRVAVAKLRVGDVAGSLYSDGYIYIYVLGKRHKAHRLAWFYMTGEHAKGDVDHKDEVKNNNRWDNLREATRAQNVINAKPNSKNTSGFRGVSFFNAQQKWCARLCVRGRKINLGYYTTKELAASAYRAAAVEHFGAFVPDVRI